MGTKILIIKLGYSETLDQEIGRTPSLGDVVRTTPVLWALKEKYPDANVSWLVSEQAEPLILGNPLIDRILVWDSFVPFQLMKERFDVLINLEKIPGICALSDMIDAWVKYGFRFDSNTGHYHAYEKGLDFITYIESKKYNVTRGYWQQALIEMLGITWREQPYSIGYEPKTIETFDIGFNHEVGSKWPLKALPMAIWRGLEKRLMARGYSISWQQGTKNLNDYMDWINSCRMIITNDSLGLHLAFMFNKKLIGLFGPTDPNEVYFYYGCKLVKSDIQCDLMPCCAPKCQTGQYCMTQIDAATIEQSVIEIMNPSETAHEQ